MSKNNIKVNAIASTLVRILNIIFPLLTGPYLTRILDPELFGEFNKVNSLAAWFIPFAGFGVYNYGIRLVSGVRENKAKASHNFSLLFYASTLSSIVFGLRILITCYYTGFLFSKLLFSSYMLNGWQKRSKATILFCIRRYLFVYSC